MSITIIILIFLGICKNIGGVYIVICLHEGIVYTEINRVAFNSFCINIKGFNKRDNKGLMYFQGEYLDD
jgi:hypothetical protein